MKLQYIKTVFTIGNCANYLKVTLLLLFLHLNRTYDYYVQKLLFHVFNTHFGDINPSFSILYYNGQRFFSIKKKINIKVCFNKIYPASII